MHNAAQSGVSSLGGVRQFRAAGSLIPSGWDYAGRVPTLYDTTAQQRTGAACIGPAGWLGFIFAARELHFDRQWGRRFVFEVEGYLKSS